METFDAYETTREWRVTWFPFEGPPWQVTKTGDEERVRALAAERAEFNPIIETRTVVASAWEMIE